MRAFIFLISATTMLGVANAYQWCGDRGAPNTYSKCKAFNDRTQTSQIKIVYQSTSPPGCYVFGMVFWNEELSSTVDYDSTYREPGCACVSGYKWNENSNSCVLPPEVCDADAKAVCASAHKESCSSGSTTCGACLDGYEADGDVCVRTSAKILTDLQSCDSSALEDLQAKTQDCST